MEQYWIRWANRSHTIIKISYKKKTKPIVCIFQGITVSDTDNNKNIVKHTAKTIVSWANPKQWLIIHISESIMIIRCITDILKIIGRDIRHYMKHDVYENEFIIIKNMFVNLFWRLWPNVAFYFAAAVGLYIRYSREWWILTPSGYSVSTSRWDVWLRLTYQVIAILTISYWDVNIHCW